MTQMVTRCPKCATAFRITSTQLESAKGAVRCGSCLHIFKAQDYWVKSAAPETATQVTIALAAVIAEKNEASIAAAPAAAPTVKEPHAAKPTALRAAEPEKTAPATKSVIDKAKALEDEDDVLISDDMDKPDEKASTYEFDGFLDLNMQPKQTISLFEREIRYESLNDDDDNEKADESWAEDLLDDDEETLHQLKKAPPPFALAPAPESKPELIKPIKQRALSETANEHSSTYAGPTFSLVSESADEPNTEQTNGHGLSEAFLNATRAPEAAPTAESAVFAAALFEAQADDEPEEKTPNKRPVKSSTMRAFDTSRAALLMNIMPAPVEFTAKRMRRWYQQKLWPTLSIFMAALLFFQVAYFKFDYFSRIEPSRTAYLFTCPLFGCEVPSLVDTTLVEATNLIVRNHPEVANALLVDAILINKAPFEQPFPNLILSFSKIDDTLVASRLFTAKEYLFGELAGMKYIPMNQPVHITLEISDPGADAPNYSLITHSTATHLAH